MALSTGAAKRDDQVGDAMAELDVRVLGPIEVSVDGVDVPLRGHTERTLLIALVLSVDHAVPADHLVQALWGDEPPPSAQNTMQSAISRLRKKLEGAITGDGHSYRLAISPDCIDVIRFERLVVAAEEAMANDPKLAADLSAEAMELWSGVPFGDLADDELVLAESQRLHELRSTAEATRLEADVALGRFASVIARLRAELVEQPYRERLWALLMVALARAGRRVEALRTYDEVWGVMASVGLEPSRELQELQNQIVEEAPPVRPVTRPMFQC
jgi:DNA-binding SARP family transcriptional activator